MEIETAVSGSKNEINIMCIMPFIIIASMESLGNEAITANTPLNVAVKFIAVILFVIAYVIGRKITDIKL